MGMVYGISHVYGDERAEHHRYVKANSAADSAFPIEQESLLFLFRDWPCLVIPWDS